MNNTVLIMAGGSGQRLWPLSTQERPKQLLSLFSERTMLRETVDRVLPLVDANRIFIATNIMQSKAIMNELPFIPTQNIIIEPAFKDTAAAIGYASIYIDYCYPDAEIIVLASDHVIKNEESFRNVLVTAIDEAYNNGSIVTIGIKPTKPETGFGYIEIEPDSEYGGVVAAKRFCEKPCIERAIEYIEQGNYLWNSGMFIFNVRIIFREFKEYMPKHYQTLMEMKSFVETGLWGEALSDEVAFFFEAFERISIDFGIMEHSKVIKVIPAEFGWNDIGSFTAFEDLFEPNENGTICRSVRVNELNSRNNIIIGTNKQIATIGIEDVVIVQTEDTVLICKKDQVQDIKKLLG
ncbi:MAG: mannose-1-phosphate guanyltransferase [Firmicutes bacterium HGW-Firmicutes-1]|jgi:mannose-1-phosphate guanylyltransferase|nr:MAG: mannose-1-phosphate guanyltransferase [Firmicutes bacterium HGW-Firmicutes-1]